MAAEQPEPGRRERKKQRTRELIQDAAYRLFAAHGFEQTTVNEIAAEADVSPGTFFNHFPAKESVLFNDRTALIEQGTRTIIERDPAEPPIEALVRVMIAMLDAPGLDAGSDRERLRLEIVMGSPVLRGLMFQRMFDIQDQLAEALRATDPDLGELEAAALVGAVMGAGGAAVQTALQSGLPLEESLRQALAHITRHLQAAAG